MPFDRHQTI
jgi:hypothetical protein